MFFNQFLIDQSLIKSYLSACIKNENGWKSFESKAWFSYKYFKFWYKFYTFLVWSARNTTLFIDICTSFQYSLII